MGRLIDAEALKKDILSQSILGETMGKILDRYLHLVDSQPTAFDVDKIAEQLENYLFEKYCVEGDSEIERIVKGGGVEWDD